MHTFNLGNCATKRCRCSKSRQACTDFCSCDHDYCENTDVELLVEEGDEGEEDVADGSIV